MVGTHKKAVMLLSDKLNISQFFRCGFYTTTLNSKTWLDRLTAQVSKEEFKDQIYNPDTPTGRYDEVYQIQKPDWDKGRPSNEAPSIYDEFFSQVASDYSLKWFHENFGSFTQKTIMCTRYLKDGGIGFHHDVKESTAIIVLLYLTDSDFELTDGGFLKMGRVPKLGPTAMPDAPIEAFGGEMPPFTGRMILLNNFDPTFVHRVSQIVVPKVRFTISCQLGWISNVSKIWANTKMYRG